MKRGVLLFGVLIAVLSLSAGQEVLKGAAAIAKFPTRLQDSDIAHLTDASWCQILPGVEYFYGRFDKLYDTTANDVSFFKIDYRNAPLRMKFVDNRRNGGSNKQTSYVASKCDALFGINATFPDWFSKMEGTVVKDGYKDGGLAFNDDKTFEFFKSSWFTEHPQGEGFANVFSTEAMGLYHGNQFLTGITGRAPYTFLGATTNGVLYICVVDGRTSRSQGLSYGTTHAFLVELGCYDGMCIDGGGSTTMVCRKDLIPADINPLVHPSDNADAKPNYYTMNHTTDNPERAVCNQLMFVEDVGTITSTLGRHGSCSLGSGKVKFEKNSSQSFTITADSGYLIAGLAVNGELIAAAKGKASYTGTLVAAGDESIVASFARRDAWWMNPTVRNDFLLEAKSGNAATDLTTQHPDVCLDEEERDVFFSTSVHGYSAGSYLTGLREYGVADLKARAAGETITPVMGTDKNVNGTGIYAYSIAASRAAGAVIAMQKPNSGTKYPVVCPIGGEWGGGSAFGSTRDDRYVTSVMSFPDDVNQYHTTSPGVFGTDGTKFYGGYSRNSHIHEFDVRRGSDGRLEFHHTGKVIKFKANVSALARKSMSVGGQMKDLLFTAIHSSSLDAICIVTPGELQVATNSSSLPVTLTIPYKLDNIAVTGLADGTPRVIGHVLNTSDAQHGNYVVYDLVDDLSGFRFAEPIAVVDAQTAFGRATGCVASLDDDSAAFINYYSAKELHALTVCGRVESVELPEIVDDPKSTLTGSSGGGYVLRPGFGNKSVTVRIPDGVDASKVRVEVSPSVETVKPAGATLAVMVGANEITGYLSIPVATAEGVVDLSSATVRPEYVREALDVDKGAQIDLHDLMNPSLTTARTRPGLTYVLCEGRALSGLASGDSTVGNGSAWTPHVTVRGGTCGFYAIGVTK